MSAVSLVGGTLAAAASLFLGWQCSKGYQRRAESLRQLHDAFLHLRARLLAGREPLPEALAALFETDPVLGQVLAALPQGLAGAWKQTLGALPGLSAADRSCVTALTDRMAQMGWQPLLQALENLVLSLHSLSREAAAAAEQSGRLSRTLGLLGAIAAIVLGL